jgi:ribosomal protein L11 methyltransferase
LDIAPRIVRAEIETLVRAAELVYRYEFGASFIERSFERPVRLGQHIVVTPPPGPQYLSPGDLVIKLMPGAAFGTGRHPTTRLCIRGLEYIAHAGARLTHRTTRRIIDIGTGSGILLIAASRLQLGSGLGIDIDPCARYEARHNIALNQLEGALEIAATPLEQLSGSFDVIIANLRYPTLQRLVPWFAGHCLDQGLLVLSGMQVDEQVALERKLGSAGFGRLWHRSERKWMAGIFRKAAQGARLG